MFKSISRKIYKGKLQPDFFNIFATNNNTMGFLSSIYNPQKPRGFNMPTRYYDKQKEEREHRRAVVLQQVKLEKGEELPKGVFVSDLHRKFEQNKISNRRKGNSSIRALVMLAFLIFLGLYFIIRL